MSNPNTAEADTADRIFDAALELFAARGYAGVSVRDIAEQAGINKALVFYHHGSKAQLFEAILTRYYGEYARVLEEAMSSDGAWSDRMHALLDGNLDFIEENSQYVRIVQNELALESEHLSLIRRGMTLLYQAVAEVLADHTTQEGPLAARHFFVSMSGMVNTYFLQAAALQALWPTPPLRVAALRERRVHLHWMLDAVLQRLEALPTA